LGIETGDQLLGTVEYFIPMANTCLRGDSHHQLEGMIKKVIQQGRSDFDARSVHGVREHGKMTRTLLAAFFNIPCVAVSAAGKWCVASSAPSSVSG
jgi:hypothetical protein